jgi:hypothetical protein
MLLRGDANEITNASLIGDIKAKFPLASEFNIYEKALVIPRTTVIEMEREDSSIRISIRPDDNMTIDLGYYAPLISKEEPLPEDFLDYNIEIAIGFWDNPEDEHSDDVIFMSEFFKAKYPGIVIFDWNRNRW